MRTLDTRHECALYIVYKETHMKDWKVGLKVGLGFGVLIMIACALGAVGIIGMNVAENGAVRLAEEYIPEMDVANTLERHVQSAMYAMRGYSLSQEPRFLDEARKVFDSVRAALLAAEKHAEKYPRLVKLKEDCARAQAKFKDYLVLADETDTKLRAATEMRTRMDASAAQLMASAGNFLKSQIEQSETDVNNGVGPEKMRERIRKIAMVQEIIELADDARVKNFKAQATGNAKLVDEMAKNFPLIFEKVNTLKSISFREINPKALGEITAGATGYQASVSAFFANWTELKALAQKRSTAAAAVVESARAVSTDGIESTRAIANTSVGDLSRAATIMEVGLALAVLLSLLIARDPDPFHHRPSVGQR